MDSYEVVGLLDMTSGQDKRQTLRDLFRQNGRSIGTWADDMGFKRSLVYAVLSGRAVGDRGEAHSIAIALGLKAHPQRPLPGKAGPEPPEKTRVSAAPEKLTATSKKEVA